MKMQEFLKFSGLVLAGMLLILAAYFALVDGNNKQEKIAKHIIENAESNKKTIDKLSLDPNIDYSKKVDLPKPKKTILETWMDRYEKAAKEYREKNRKN